MFHKINEEKTEDKSKAVMFLLSLEKRQTRILKDFLD